MAASGSSPGIGSPGGARPGYPASPSAIVPAPQIVNQWAGTVTQNPALGPSIPANASCIVSLTPDGSAGSGSGYPTAGNWLFCIVGWNGTSVPPATLASVSDDTHMWWRPASPSSAEGDTRTVIWYQPNIGAGQSQNVVPSMVYVAPGGYMAGLVVTVVEVSGIGPWDTVEGTVSEYQNDAISASLGISTPAGTSFVICGCTGNDSAAGTEVTGDGWTSLETVTATNGTDSTGDTAVAAAYITTAEPPGCTIGGTSSQAFSGFMIAVLQSAPSPVPDNQNPAWPTLIFEAGFGSGYLTPPDEITWTQLLPDSAGVARLRSWGDETGTQYELDQIQTSEATLLLDNPDAALTPDNTASIYYPDVVPGTPLRLRAIPPPASADNHWYAFQRYAETWPQSWESTLRGIVEMTGNDPWQSVAKECPAAYRAEVLADNPYAWWPCDDPAVIPQPASLVNAAPGSSFPLEIVTSINGLSSSVSGYPFSTDYYYSATQTFADASQWMYGDPDSAAWTQAGASGDADTGGTFGRFLRSADPGIPPVSGGLTIEGWWNVAFYASGSGTTQGPYQQSDSALVLWSLSNIAPPEDIAIAAQLVCSGSGGTGEGGELYLITYDGDEPTAHLIQSGNTRVATWLGVTVTLTDSAWSAWVNGTLLASGDATVNDGTYGFSALGNQLNDDNVQGICNASVAHLAIYPQVLPQQRIMAHYVAAYTGFGQVPSPSISGQFVETGGASTYFPDGGTRSGDAFVTPGFSGYANLAAVATAVLGDYVSAPAAPESITAVPPNSGSEQTGAMWLTADVPAAPQYAWYTSQGAGNEELASTTTDNYLYVDSFGSGASPPAEASALGDTVQQRIERLLVHGLMPQLARAIDPASSPVVAALDTGGQQAGANIGNITASDSGLLFEDNASVLCYWDKPHLEALANAPAKWVLGPDTAAGQIPYDLPGDQDGGWTTDPQRVLNDIQITQYNVAPNAVSADTSGTGENQTIPGVTYSPSGSYYDQVLASQQQYGPKQVQNGSTSYLQSGTSIQNQANWLFTTYGQPVTRITGIQVDVASKSRTVPQAWTFFFGANIGDTVQATRHFPGQPSITGTWLITHLDRTLTREKGQVTGSIIVQADIAPSSYWS